MQADQDLSSDAGQSWMEPTRSDTRNIMGPAFHW